MWNNKPKIIESGSGPATHQVREQTSHCSGGGVRGKVNEDLVFRSRCRRDVKYRIRGAILND